MKESTDDLIEKTLRSLREAQPAPAFEQRVLAAVRARTARPERTPFRWPLPLAFAAALILVIFYSKISSIPPEASRNQPTAQHNSFNLPGGPLNALSSKLTTLQKTRQHPVPNPSAAEQAAVNLSPAASDAVQTAADQQASDDTHAPSHPAPPMPLTVQERLLLYATRQGSPIELAELQPSRELALRTEMQERQRAAIEKYVERMLAPLATSESFNPTPPIADEAPATPQPELLAPPSQ